MSNFAIFSFETSMTDFQALRQEYPALLNTYGLSAFFSVLCIIFAFLIRSPDQHGTSVVVCIKLMKIRIRLITLMRIRILIFI